MDMADPKEMVGGIVTKVDDDHIFITRGDALYTIPNRHPALRLKI